MSSSLKSHSVSATLAVGQKRPSVPSRDGKVAKRAKKEKTKPELPPEIWALILEFLVYSEVMQCTAVSPFFLHDVLSKVQTLFMNKKGQLVTKQAKRFKNGVVKSIFILSYVKRVSLEQDPDEVCLDTALRIVPFLQQFPYLKYVMFGGFLPPHLQDADNPRFKVLYPDVQREETPTGVLYQRFLVRSYADRVLNEETNEHKRTHCYLLGTLASAFYSGLLPSDLHIGEDMETNLSVAEEDRSLCKAVCGSFPFDQLFSASVNQVFHEDRSISVETFFDILSKRPGGLEFLRDPKRLMEVFFPEAGAFNDMEYISLLSRAGCDPRGLAHDDLIARLGRSRPIIFERQNFRKLQELGFDLQDEDYEEYFVYD